MKFVIVWGGNSKLRGGNFPPKGPERSTDQELSHDMNPSTAVDVLLW